MIDAGIYSVFFEPQFFPWLMQLTAVLFALVVAAKI